MFQYTKVSPFLGIVLGISSLSATRMTSAEFLILVFLVYRSVQGRVSLGLITTAFFANLRPIFERLFSLLHLSEQIEIKQIFLTEVDAGCICVCTSTSPYTFYYLLFFYFIFLKK